MASPQRPSAARLLPSGDAYYLLWGADREILVPNAKRRAELWTTRVWPGALLVDGEIVGVWRRSAAEVSIDAWRRFSSSEREAVEAEAMSLPVHGLNREINVSWNRLLRRNGPFGIPVSNRDSDRDTDGRRIC